MSKKTMPKKETATSLGYSPEIMLRFVKIFENELKFIRMLKLRTIN